jgi:TMEM175 potassium channel family protein
VARLETFADGVFAIAATLLILSVDSRITGVHIGGPLTHAWPSYVAYAVSFVTIGIMWMNHHNVMNQIARIDRRFILATIGLLMCVAFVPFPTRLLAEHVRDSSARDAALAYGFTLVVTSIFFDIVWFYASVGRRLLRDDADPRIVAGITRSYLPGPWIYLAATLIAFASSWASAILYLVIAAFYVVESSVFAGKASAD